MRESLRTRKAKAVVAAVALVALLGSLWGITYTPLFSARQISVEGAAELTQEEVLALAGVGERTNVFHFDADAAVQRLEQSPWILHATVATDLPGGVHISIQERIAVIAAGDGVAVAADGVSLPGAALDGLPQLQGADASAPEARSAAMLLASMTPILRSSVASLSVDDGEVTLSLDSGTSVSVGPPGEEGEKAEALRAVLEWASQEGAAPAIIDVRVPTAPTVTLEDGGSVTP